MPKKLFILPVEQRMKNQTLLKCINALTVTLVRVNNDIASMTGLQILPLMEGPKLLALDLENNGYKMEPLKQYMQKEQRKLSQKL